MRALIADDEPLARRELAETLRRLGRLDAIDEVEDGIQALALLQERAYDLLFLDIRMPGLGGLEAMTLINRLPRRPAVIFVTAYDEHALAAFELAATDYLLKPVSEVRLRRTLERVGSARTGPPTAAARVARDRLPVGGEDRTILVRIADIRFVHVRGHDVLVRTFEAEHRSRASLAELTERLAAHGFMRVHRAYLVNIEHVLEVSPFYAGTYLLRVDDRGRSEVPVSRACARHVRALFAPDPPLRSGP